MVPDPTKSCKPAQQAHDAPAGTHWASCPSADHQAGKSSRQKIRGAERQQRESSHHGPGSGATAAICRGRVQLLSPCCRQGRAHPARNGWQAREPFGQSRCIRSPRAMARILPHATTATTKTASRLYAQKHLCSVPHKARESFTVSYIQ